VPGTSPALCSLDALMRMCGEIDGWVGQLRRGAAKDLTGRLVVLPTDVVNAADRGLVSDRAVWPARVVVA
jgi:hypothetical protein